MMRLRQLTLFLKLTMRCKLFHGIDLASVKLAYPEKVELRLGLKYLPARMQLFTNGGKLKLA
jgi:hypothetical protein